MNLYSQVFQALQGMGEHQLRALSTASGVPFPTIRNIKYGITKNPGVLTVQAVADFLHTANGARDSSQAQ